MNADLKCFWVKETQHLVKVDSRRSSKRGRFSVKWINGFPNGPFPASFYFIFVFSVTVDTVDGKEFADDLIREHSPLGEGSQYSWSPVLLIWIQLVHCIQKTTYFICRSRSILSNWRPAVQWSFHQRWVISGLIQTAGRHNNCPKPINVPLCLWNVYTETTTSQLLWIVFNKYNVMFTYLLLKRDSLTTQIHPLHFVLCLTKSLPPHTIIRFMRGSSLSFWLISNNCQTSNH